MTVAEPLFRVCSGSAACGGRIRTFELCSKVRERVAEDGRGCVRVVDGGGPPRRSLLRDMPAEQAVARRERHPGPWLRGRGGGAGGLPPGGRAPEVQALAAWPMKTDQRGVGDVDMAVNFAGVDLVPGHYLCADANGIVVSDRPFVD